MRRTVNREKTAFRTLKKILYRDIRRIAGFSRGLISILGDIRQPGEDQALKLLYLLQQKPVNNPIMFEMFQPAPLHFLEEISQAAPGFSLDISPNSHDPKIRRAMGQNFSNEDMETMLEAALKLGAGRVEVFFMIGLTEQTRESVMQTLDYCEHLLRKFDGDRRLFFLSDRWGHSWIPAVWHLNTRNVTATSCYATVWKNIATRWNNRHGNMS